MKMFCLLICSAAAVAGAEWAQFRGPQASGVDRSVPLPTTWNVEKRENVAWEAAVPGLAHSSPIVWQDRVYVSTVTSSGSADLKVGLYGDIGAANDNGPQTWRLLAIDLRDGKVVWDKVAHEVPAPRVKRHTKASHANSTPATDGKRIVTFLGSEGLFCFDMEGALIWKKDLGPMDSGFFSSPTAQWGFGASLINASLPRGST